MHRLTTTLILTLALLSPASALTPEHADLISRAGNSSVETERYRLLVELSERTDLDPQLRADLQTLLPSVDLWANERKHWNSTVSRRAAENGFLCGFFSRNYPPPIDEDSPLYPIWAMYRGRMIIQVPIQSGGIQRDPVRRSEYFEEGRDLLRVAKAAFPENRLVRLYLDETFPWPALNPRDPNAPAWANNQRETLEKLADIITWWIETRQAPDGQLGGGWGDDVEIWRTWTPVLIGFEDTVAVRGQTAIAEGLYALDRMKGGYTSYMTDVEHTGEDSGDTCTSMMHLRPDDPLWQGRARRIFTLFRDLWTGRNDRGLLQFKSTYFTSERVDTTAQRACDTVYHPRAVQPALLYWQRTADTEMTAVFSDWARTWVDAAASTDRGKPAGILPSAIHWPDGMPGGVSGDWWDPRNHSEPGLYFWPSAMRMMTNTLLLTSHMTGDPSYLEPVRTMAKARAAWLADPVDDPQPGTEAWCASRMGIAETLAKYRLLTGDDTYDDLLLKDANGYVRFRLTGERAHLEAGMERAVAAFRINEASYKQEVRWTDRQFAFNSRYANHYADPPLPRPATGALYGAITGDFGGALYFPMNAVRWKTPPRDIAVLVSDSGPDRFRAELYHFGQNQREMDAELYLLEKGDYVVDLVNTVTGKSTRNDLTVDGPRSRITLAISPGALYTLSIRKA